MKHLQIYRKLITNRKPIKHTNCTSGSSKSTIDLAISSFEHTYMLYVIEMR